MHTYEQNALAENHGIYTALFDNLRDSGVSDLTNQYVTAQKLDARFAFENNKKELLFDNFQLACDVLLAKYYTKWVNLIQGVLKSVPKHQYESGRAIGLTERQIFFYIIIPQTVRSLIPLSMNLITRMIKTTSLVVFVGVIEVVKIGQQIIEANRLKNPYASIAIYFVIFMMYFFVCWILSLAASYIEKRQKR